ncbi:hypothetical protein [Photobacterium lutimaris]|uniref:Uncharacterized protein n=1 Tax=Photobacterium lutimaris TaxID=388278 RepID=A0A2T3J2M5_9GAMM|nr:hypothetical protein [Photobacterium lutimaris]PSU35503.1 hypothetical protein C9I99_00325 [Photobacterium lutimaris]TDR78550.1 hypothetical protein DFP78_10161 [Photobacterium lutimaris]
MNRLIISTVLLAFSTATLADLNISRSESGSWTEVSYQKNNEMSPLPHSRRVEARAKNMKVNQLYIPQSLKDARKQQNNHSLSVYDI